MKPSMFEVRTVLKLGQKYGTDIQPLMDARENFLACRNGHSFFNQRLMDTSIR